MKLAFSRSARGDEEREQLFASYRAGGFDGLQLKSNQYADYLTDPARFLARWPNRPGLASGLIHGGVLDADGEETLRQVIAFGKAAGSELVIFWPKDPRGDNTDLTSFARRVSALGAEAREAGLKLSLHHHHNQIVMTEDEIAEFFAQIEPGTVGLTVDTAHLVKSGMDDVPAVIRRFAPVIDNFHLKDYDPEAGAWRVIGRGQMPFAAIFAAIKAIGYDGWVCADEESRAEYTAALADSYAALAAGLSTEMAARP